MRNLVIVGGGFAGVWAALGAARARRAAGALADVGIVLVSRDPWLAIRPRLYETALDGLRVPLDRVLRPLGVDRIEGDVVRLDPVTRSLSVEAPNGRRTLRYDDLVLAAGSRLRRPPVPGADWAFSVDTYPEAEKLGRHLGSLAASDDHDREGRFTAVVVGAGFTGIEVATGLVARMKASAMSAGAGDRARVVVVERAPAVAPDLGDGARRHVEDALTALEIESRVGASVTAVDRRGVRLGGGEWIPARTVVWTGGFLASALAEQLPVERDSVGRVPVDAFLRIEGVDGIFAAGDVARAMADADHVAPMSCQYAIPMGELAGENAARELLGLPSRPFAPPNHVTCLDLGQAGALFMEGWDRRVKLTGSWAKLMKETINRRLIYPPEESEGSGAGHDRGGRHAA